MVSLLGFRVVNNSGFCNQLVYFEEFKPYNDSGSSILHHLKNPAQLINNPDNAKNRHNRCEKGNKD